MEYNVIGIIIRIIDNSDTENPTTEVLQGFHLNARGEVPESWLPFELTEANAQRLNDNSFMPPTVPYRIYQEGVTRYFRFPDEQSFRAVEPEVGDEQAN